MGALSIRNGSHDLDIGADGRIDRAAVRPSQRRVVDASGCDVVAGFVDVQVNGGWGVDLTGEPERIDELAVRLPSTGVTSFAPTVVTAPEELRERAVRVLGSHATRPRLPHAARSLGVHLEGPFLAPLRKGAHPERHLLPPDPDVARWSADDGVALVTLAPELPGALEVVRALVSRGVVVCAGHTAATAAELDAAVAAGVTGATHLFNAMGPFGSREPGTVGPLLAHPTMISGLIVDGVHVDPVMVAVAWRALGPRQIALVTDAIAALGHGTGSARIGRIEIVVDEVSARTRDGVLAGSILRMDQAVRNLRTFTGCTLADASTAASATPARLLRRGDLGELEQGRWGDVVLLDGAGEVAATIIAGEVAFDRDGRESRPS